jgi:hypothetical protein
MAYSDGNVQFIIHTDDFFIHLSEDFLEISPQYRGTTLALFDVVIRKEYKNENDQSFSPLATVDSNSFLRC